MEKLSDDFKMAESVYEKQGSGEIEEGGWMKMKRKKKSRRHIYTREGEAFLCRIIESRNSSARSAPLFPSAGRDGWTRGCGHVDYREWERERESVKEIEKRSWRNRRAQLFGRQPKSHFNCPNKNNLGLEHTEEKSAERGGGKTRTFDSR